MSVITSDIELLEVSTHILSHICSGCVLHCYGVVCASTTNWILGAIALVSYLIVGVAVPALCLSSERTLLRQEDLASKLSTVTLDNLRES